MDRTIARFALFGLRVHDPACAADGTRFAAAQGAADPWYRQAGQAKEHRRAEDLYGRLPHRTAQTGNSRPVTQERFFQSWKTPRNGKPVDSSRSNTCGCRFRSIRQ